MIYKSLEDLNRVIALGKPQKVIDLVAQSYLEGVAAQPYIDAEDEYAELKVQEDVPDVEEVTDAETGEVLTEAYSTNTVRDERIAELEAEYPYLAEEDGERPELELDETLVAPQLRIYAKIKRTEAMEALNVITESGKQFDADEISQGRMARAIIAAEAAGQSETNWGMADNTVQVVTLAEMKEALGKAMVAQGELWFI